MNRLGHCASYHSIEEIETALALEAKKDKAIPHGMKPYLGSGLGVAWDNFVRFIDTFNGKDTLHDTVGIAYQKVSEDQNGEIATVEIRERNDRSEQQQSKKSYHKRKRTYEPSKLNLEPYRKKPRLSKTTTSATSIEDTKKQNAALLLDSREKNVIWMLTVLYDDRNKTPMWKGWKFFHAEMILQQV